MAIDRNARARVIFCAEAYERRTKEKGKRGGKLMPSGIQLLRCIAFKFLNLAKGAAWPSYDALQEATGLCRQAIADAIKRLEACGFLLVTRRTRWEAGKLIKLTNLYMLPIETPPLPEFAESLLSRRKQRALDLEDERWEESDLKKALDRLQEIAKERTAKLGFSTMA